MSEQSEQDEERLLVERAKANPAEFDHLYILYVDRIYAYLWQRVRHKGIAEDITAVTFEKALRNIKKFEWRGITFVAWLYRIAHNELVNYHRKQKFLTPLSAIEQWWKSDVSVEVEVQKQSQADQLRKALRSLSEKDQELVMLKFYDGLSSREVGEILGYTENNVNVRVYRALKRLKQEMAQLESTVGAEQHAS